METLNRNPLAPGQALEKSHIRYAHPVLSSDNSSWERLELGLFSKTFCKAPEHRLAYHNICINYGGLANLTMVIDGKSATKTMAPTTAVLFPAQVWQSHEWREHASFLCLYLDPTLINEVSQELQDNDHLELVPNADYAGDPLLYQMAVALKAALEVDAFGSKLYADAMANALAAHLAIHYSTRKVFGKLACQGLSSSSLRQVIDYINTHLEQNLSLAELAAIARLSPYHFTRLFKQSTGFSPHKYHIHCRIERAKQLLQARTLSLPAIAHSLGFSSQSHFNYHFKKLTGATPKQYLKNG